MAIIKKSINKHWRRCAEKGILLGGNVNWHSYYGEQYGGATILSSNLTPVHTSRENYIIIKKKNTCTPIFIATLFSIAKTWKQLVCLSTNEWIKM